MHYQIYLAGREGFEPTTHGFGVRCSTVGATGLQSLRFFMDCVLPTAGAIFLFAQAIGGLRFIFVCGIIAIFTIVTG
jgi:hypothetical protein